MVELYLLSLYCFLGVAHGIQPSAQLPVPAPLRELPWGPLNFLHTTDTHGWHAGHLQELVSPFQSYSQT
jgi:2',3'-cyclic-nucleotide 2'-phosphodiesterase (5'-nucleotidase family)